MQTIPGDEHETALLDQKTDNRNAHGDEAPAFLSGRPAVLALFALGASAACFVTAEGLPIGLLPQISASTHISLSVGGLLVTIYALVVVIATLPLTHLTRKLPRRVLLAALAAVLILGCVVSAAAPDFWVLLGARIITALGQAVFWAVGPVEASNVVRPELRGRAVSAVFAGSAGGLVLGVPVCTLLGHLVGWRLAFLALSAAALLLLTMIVIAVPSRESPPPQEDEKDAPGQQLYRVTVVLAALSVAAFYSAYTYVSPFLTRISGVSHGSVTLVLLGAGLASTLGLSAGGVLYTRYGARAMAIASATMTVALGCLFAFARETSLAPLFVAVDSLGLGLLCVAGQTAVIEVGPHNGTAWFSTSFNVGIATGPLIGGLTLATGGLRSTALAGALIAAIALGLALSTGRLVARAGSRV